MSSDRFQSVRGTQDILGEEWKKFRHLEDVALACGDLYGFTPLETPTFEHSEVFHRSLGESSDMVSKETYSFVDRGGDQLTLRPEGTAGVVRAFVSNGWAQNLPVKYLYTGSMYRYERPQKGRLRQFHQLGVEALGYEQAWMDVECLSFADQFLSTIGVRSACQLRLNTLGDAESRQAHRLAFVEYLQPYKDQLSADSQLRLQKNPLRIFDSKDPADQEIIRSAPRLDSHLNSFSRDFFSQVCQGLSALGISYQLDPGLVRGIDYYTHTVFEFLTDQLGAQGAVLSGGRYNGLVEQMGGKPTPGIGWACGMERLSLLIGSDSLKKVQAPICVFALEERYLSQAFQVVQTLRKKGKAAEFLEAGSPGKKIKKANKLGAEVIMMLGEDEVARGCVMVKNLRSGEQALVPLSELVNT